MEFVEKNYRFYRDISQLGVFNMLSLVFVEKFSGNVNLHKKIVDINLDNQELSMYNFWSIGDSIKNFDKKFLIINVRLHSIGKRLGHANVLLFERKDGKTYVERYDPSYEDFSYNQKVLDESIKRILKPFGVIFTEFNCTAGPQSVSLDVYGYCQTYTVEYLLKRLNTNMSSVNIKREMLRETIDLDAHYNQLDNRIKEVMSIIITSKYVTSSMTILLLNYNVLDNNQKMEVAEYLCELYAVLIEN